VAAGVGQWSLPVGAATEVATIGQGPIRNILPPTRDREPLFVAPAEPQRTSRPEATKPASLPASAPAMAVGHDESESSFGGAMVAAVGVMMALAGGGVVWRQRRRA
jgi:hypothetical protein